MSVNDILFEGADYHYQGKLDEAIKCFKNALTMDFNNSYAHNQLGVIYAKKKMFEEAFKEFDFVSKTDPENTFCRIWQGLLYLKKEDWNSSKKVFEEVLKIDPQNADAYYFLGALYNIQHNPDYAIEMLQKARDADAAEPDTHFRLANAFHSSDLTANAELEYLRTLELNPKYTKAINELGWIYFDAGKLDKAIEFWEKAYSINPNDNETKFNLAHIHNTIARKLLKSGDKNGAVREWKKALNYYSRNYEATYYIKKYGKGD